MKKVLVLAVSTLMLAQMSFGQSVPQGMKYQAVARDLSGNIRANEIIQLKIDLHTTDVQGPEYMETHTVVTNQLGLFNITIGSGKVASGAFEKVPWSSEDVWMRVAIIDQNSDDYVTISDSKMLSVPYAFHAATASSIVGSSKTSNFDPFPGVKSDNWSLKGNYSSNPDDPDFHKLGTTDSIDFVLVTNNTQRLRIESDGDIKIAESLEVGDSLVVKQNVDLNTEGGQTTNNGPFTVTSLSPTLLTGKLTVDLETKLKRELDVFGKTTIHNNFEVANNYSSLFTGRVTISDLSPSDSAATSDGALVVGGGVGIGQNLNVGGNLAIKGSSAFGGPVSFASPVTITADEESTNTATGALRVHGGVGIAKRLNVGGATALGGDLSVNTNKFTVAALTGNTAVDGTLGVKGNFSVNTNKFTIAALTGNTAVDGTLGVKGNLSVGTDKFTVTAATGQVTINANPAGGQSNFAGYPLRVKGSTQGIAIAVTGNRTNANNYVSFWDGNGSTMWGRIEGETPAEFGNNADYNLDRLGFIYDVADGALDIVFATTDLFFTATNTVAAATSATACLGLGACVTSPIPSLIASSVAQVVVAVAQEITAIAEEAFAVANLVIFDQNKVTFQGVTYASGAGDYAEFLLRSDLNEEIEFGDIVGVKGGEISKITTGSEKMMVVSLNPIVLGKLPQQGTEDAFEKVAFMGQVPVKVFGKVNIGDYIIPSGNNDGIGIAISPSKISAKDIKKIVGVAWSTAENMYGFNLINAAVGLTNNDNNIIVEKLEQKVSDQAKEINVLRQQIAETNNKLAQLLPGFTSNSNKQPVLHKIREHAIEDNHLAEEYEIVTPHPSDIIYYKITREDLETGFEIAENQMREAGIDMEKDEFWKKIKTDPNYKNDLMNRLEVKFEKTIHYHKDINEGLKRN